MGKIAITTDPTRISFMTLLSLIFIALKISNKIDWSWWWVLCPLWIPSCFAILGILIITCVVFIGKLTVRYL